MKNKNFIKILLVFCFFVYSQQSMAVAKKAPLPFRVPPHFQQEHIGLSALYQKNSKDKKDIQLLKGKTLSLGSKSVPVLIEVMKNGMYPAKNRWVATFLLGKIMGKKSSPFISKFSKHPSWVMRMASLKTLLALKEKDYGPLYATLLKDESLLVRTQALENINSLRLTEFAPHIWSMLYDKNNYTFSENNKKRTNIIKKVITSVGKLNFKKAQAPLLSMSQKDKYKDIFPEIDQSLSMMTGQKSPEGNEQVKKIFWKNYELKNKTI